MNNEPRTLREDLATQREFMGARVPVYARLLEAIEAELDAGLESRLEAAWRGRSIATFYERPLLLLAALREAALFEGEGHPLWRAIAASRPEPEAVTQAAVRGATAPDRDRLWRTLRERFVQTNDISRAVAWLWPASEWARVRGESTLAVFDVGASAGLNLVADQLPPLWTRQNGQGLDVHPIPRVVERTGFDLRPLDPADDEDARWLRACVWPGQADRAARLDQAILAFRQMRDRDCAPAIHRGSGSPRLTSATQRPGRRPGNAASGMSRAARS